MSTYLSLHYHAAFSTKCREPAIDLAWQGRLHEFLGGTIRGLGGFPEIAGGVADHVHLLFDALPGEFHARIEEGVIGLGA